MSFADHDELVAAASNGDPQATADLVAELQPRIVRYCRARLSQWHGSYASADDVAQEAMIGILRSLPQYRGTGESFVAWAFGVTRHKVLDFQRQQARDRTVPTDETPETVDHEPGPEQRFMHTELRGELKNLLAAMNPRHREILVLRLIVGLSSEETAHAVGCSPGAVRVHQHRALTVLRKRLQDNLIAFAA